MDTWAMHGYIIVVNAIIVANTHWENYAVSIHTSLSFVFALPLFLNGLDYPFSYICGD